MLPMTTPSEDLAARLLAVLPEHKASLTIEHAPHRNNYQTVAQWLADFHEGEPDWTDATARERAIATDDVWTLQWYARTPIGFDWIAAPTLAELLAYLMREHT